MLEEHNFIEDDFNIHTFEINDCSFVMDRNTGQFMEIDIIALQVLRHHMQNTLNKENIQELYNAFGKEPILEAINELNDLRSNNILFSDNMTKKLFQFPSNKIDTICLIISNDCNLRCRYCYADTGKFGGDRSLMTQDIANRAVDFLIEQSGHLKDLNIVFFGGGTITEF